MYPRISLGSLRACCVQRAVSDTQGGIEEQGEHTRVLLSAHPLSSRRWAASSRDQVDIRVQQLWGNSEKQFIPCQRQTGPKMRLMEESLEWKSSQISVTERQLQSRTGKQYFRFCSRMLLPSFLSCSLALLRNSKLRHCQNAVGFHLHHLGIWSVNAESLSFACVQRNLGYTDQLRFFKERETFPHSVTGLSPSG